MKRLHCVPVLITFSLATLMQGCLTINAPQFQTASSLVKNMLGETVTDSNEQTAKWSARIGDEGRLVEVVKQDGFFVFVSTFGDAIAFDGWNVRSIIGFGGKDARQIIFDGEYKQFRSGEAMTSRRCERWKLRPNGSDKDAKVWIQYCDDQVRENSIVVDTAGTISEINQVIDIHGTRAVLKRL